MSELEEKNGNEDLGFESFDDPALRGPRTLGDLWRESLPFKIGVIAAGIFIISLGFVLFSGKGKAPLSSNAPKGSTVNAPPGTQATSSQYNARIAEKDEENLREAQAKGGSALPTPVGPPSERVSSSLDSETDKDPLQRWRDLQAESAAQQTVGTNPPPIPPAVAEAQARDAQAINALSQAMAAQMETILDSRQPKQAQRKIINSKSWLENIRKAKADSAALAAQNASDVTQDATTTEILLLPAGKIEYGQLLIEANSDVPGPVMAQIASGPLRGSRILGAFVVQEEYLTLEFKTLVTKNGESMSINAVALDPTTTLPGMATEVDHRYLKRVILPAAASFVEGWTEAIAESGSTTVIVDGDTVTETSLDKSAEQELNAGIAEAGSQVSDILDDMADKTKVMVKIHAGTPIGILFTEPVIQNKQEEKEDETPLQQMPYMPQSIMFLPTPMQQEGGQKSIPSPTNQQEKGIKILP